MKGPRLKALAVGLLAAGAVAAVVVVSSGGGDEPADPSEPAATTPVAAAEADPEDEEDEKAELTPIAAVWEMLGVEAAPVPEPATVARRGNRRTIANVREGESVILRDAPGGEPIAELGHTTEFGSPRNLWVERVEGDWLGVPAPELPNGVLGWIRDDPERIEIYFTLYRIRADISERRLELLYGRRVIESFPVTVGAAGSPTPPGDYAVTDGLLGAGNGPYYGCCILALTGHQPNLPSNWLGGDRIAIHGTPDAIGVAASAGCLRATDRDMVSLFARVPLGTPVFIRA
jgi:hypothetical protein